jgi:fumarylacetoacetate (FAA) hydrolase
MKLATYQDGSRDGHLVVVSRDLCTAAFANTHATRLQQLLDDWNFVAPQLHDLYLTLNHGKSRHAFAFDPALCLAPLPRAASWAWQALDADPADASRQPVLQAGAGDDMRGPRGELDLPEGRQVARVAAGVAVYTGELAMGASPAQALEAIRLLGLYSRWSLVDVDAAPGSRTRADVDAQLAPHWAPVLVTPDEAGGAWSGGRLDMALQLQWLSQGGKKRQGLAISVPGKQQRWHHGQLLAWAARNRRVRAGAVFGCDWLNEAVPQADESLIEPDARLLADSVSLDIVGRDGLSLFDRINPSFAGWAVDETTPGTSGGRGLRATPPATAVLADAAPDEAGANAEIDATSHAATTVADHVASDAAPDAGNGAEASPDSQAVAPAKARRGSTRKRTI